jgi:hypothetical protein
MFTMRTMSREIGTALAVLAIYLLTVLAPIHQARASQLAFEELGYATTQSSWVLCTPAGTIGQDQDITVSKCPAAGVGKDEMVLPLLDIAPIGHDLLALAAPLALAAAVVLPRPVAPPAGPRAPPVPV